MSRIRLDRYIAFLIIAGVAASPMFVWNFLGIVNAQNPEMSLDNSTMMSGNTTSGNDTSMMSGNISGLGRT